jgi:hypothetical protein
MWRLEMVDQLNAAPSRSRHGILEQHAQRTGFSISHLYEIAKNNGFISGRKKRADSGGCILTDAQIEFVSGLLRESARENKGVIMPVERALEIAVDNGIILSGSVSVGRMQQVLAERQLNKDALDAATPHTDMRSKHPNHVHQIDASVCIQYYLRGGKTALIDERDYNQKKMQNLAKIKTRITRYLLTDHFSGLFYVKYYLADGESQNLLYNFLISAWAHKQNDRYPFRGVPFLILWDSASAARAKAMRHFIEGLGIITPQGTPHNPRRQGSVESTQNIVERWFESNLRFQPAYGIEELNAWAHDWMVYHNASKEHTRHGMTRTASWMQIQQTQLRELPNAEVLNALYSYTADENTRLVGGNYQISFTLQNGETKKYWLKHVPGLLPGRSRVLVRINPYLWPKVNVIYNNISYEVEPVEMLPAVMGAFRADAPIIGEEYAAMPETATQAAGKRIENYAYGENPGKDASPYGGIQVMGNQADKLGSLVHMPKRGTAIEVDRESVARSISFPELLKKLVLAGVAMTPKINQELRAKYGEAIDSEEAENIIKFYTQDGSRRDAEGTDKVEQRRVYTGR